MSGQRRVREPYPQRASQLDAERLDQELISLILSQASWALRFLDPGVLTTCALELKVVLKLFVFVNTVWRHIPSPGNLIHNLRLSSGQVNGNAPYRRTSPLRTDVLLTRQRLILLFLDVIIPYVWSRLHASLLEEDPIRASWMEEALPGSWRRRIWRGMNAFETICRAVQLVNFLQFLNAGKYSRLSYRVAGVRTCYTDMSATRTVSFEYVNRQLVWYGLAEFLVFLTSVLRSTQILRMFRSISSQFGLLGSRLEGSSRGYLPGEATFPENTDSQHRVSAIHSHTDHGPNQAVQDRPCAICGSSTPKMPHKALPCRHTYCYVCLASARERDPWFACVRCNLRVHAISREKSSL